MIKTKDQIIRHFGKIYFIANKYYLNGLLYALGRNDLCIGYGERATEKKWKEILTKLKK